MAIKFHNPKTVTLAGRYALGCEVPAGSRLLSVSGQVGLDSKGKLPPGFEAQCENVWKNIGQVLKSAGMGYGDIFKMTTFLTDSRFIVPARGVRDKYIKEPYTSSTLLVVQGLADPAMLVEIEVFAAK